MSSLKWLSKMQVSGEIVSVLKAIDEIGIQLRYYPIFMLISWSFFCFVMTLYTCSGKTHLKK